MKIAITGHRPNKLGNDYELKSELIQKIRAKIQNIVDWHIMDKLPSEEEVILISGMALGIDTLFAEIAIDWQLPLICAIPCLGQEKRWPNRSQNRYKKILSYSKAKHIFVTNKDYSPEVMQKRNIWMVDNCDLLIAVFDGSPGGTANCVNYAKSINKPIIHINPKLL